MKSKSSLLLHFLYIVSRQDQLLSIRFCQQPQLKEEFFCELEYEVNNFQKNLNNIETVMQFFKIAYNIFEYLQSDLVFFKIKIIYVVNLLAEYRDHVAE